MKTKLFSFLIFVLSVCLFTRCDKDKEIVSDLTLPAVSTEPVSAITFESAKCKGIITDDGGYTVHDRGVCWSENTNPTLENNNLSGGSGKGEFECRLTNLKAGTTYYVCAYAINILGTQYGEQVDFSTLSGSVILTTNNVTSINATSAVSGGNISSDSGASVTERGIVWSTSTEPTINNAEKTSQGSGTGSFTANLTGLSPNTTYYVRAYAVNSTGIYYGNQVSFTTLSGGTNYTLDDYLGAYSIRCKVGIDTDFSTFNPVNISTVTDEDGVIFVHIEGLREGKTHFTVYGKWNEDEECILLKGGWYSPNRTFYFTNEPDIFYYSVFFPVFYDESIDTFYYLYGGETERGEAKLLMNSDGTISYQGAAPDKNNRTANGFVHNFYLESTGDYKGYFSVYSHITLIPSSSLSGVKLASSLKSEAGLSYWRQEKNQPVSSGFANGTVRNTVDAVK